jgi:hypothetical protein
LAEKTKNEINQTFDKLKTLLANNKYKIVAEEPPYSVTAVQGSIWGTSPKTAKKKTTYTLTQRTQEIRVTSTTHLASDYINMTLVGCVFSVALLFLCFWIALDLQSSATSGASFWSWLTFTAGQFDANEAAVFIRLTWILVAFLAVSLAVEAFIISRVRSGIGVFAQEIVKALKE